MNLSCSGKEKANWWSGLEVLCLKCGHHSAKVLSNVITNVCCYTCSLLQWYLPRRTSSEPSSSALSLSRAPAWLLWGDKGLLAHTVPPWCIYAIYSGNDLAFTEWRIWSSVSFLKYMYLSLTEFSVAHARHTIFQHSNLRKHTLFIEHYVHAKYQNPAIFTVVPFFKKSD